LLALAVAVPEPDELLVTCGVSTNKNENTMPGCLKTGLEVHAVDPEIDLLCAPAAAALPLRQFFLPALFEPADRRWREARGLWAQEGLERFGDIPGRDALEVQLEEKGFQTFGAANLRWKKRGVQLYPSAIAIPHPWHLHTHGPNAGLHRALRKVAMPDHRLAALGIMAVSILG
jgi:hypothetical protein